MTNQKKTVVARKFPEREYPFNLSSKQCKQFLLLSKLAEHELRGEGFVFPTEEQITTRMMKISDNLQAKSND